jgi:acid phosphatase
VEFKAAERRKLAEQGWVIAVNVGDQASDLDGGHAERTYRLPNPFYLVP